MRSAPSSRITSPLSISFSMIVIDERAVLGRRAQPRRERHRCTERVARLLGQAAEQRRVEDPGRDRHAADPAARQVTGDRQRHPDDSTLRRRIGRLSDLTVERRDRGGVDDHAAAVTVGLVGRHRRRREADHIEGADQVDLDRRRKRVQRRRLALAQDPSGRADPSAVDQHPKRAAVRGERHRRANRIGIAHVGGGERELRGIDVLRLPAAGRRRPRRRRVRAAPAPWRARGRTRRPSPSPLRLLVASSQPNLVARASGRHVPYFTSAPDERSASQAPPYIETPM